MRVDMRNFLYNGRPPKVFPGNKRKYSQPAESALLNLCRHYHCDPVTVLNLPNFIVQAHIVILSEEHQHEQWKHAQEMKKRKKR